MRGSGLYCSIAPPNSANHAHACADPDVYTGFFSKEHFVVTENRLNRSSIRRCLAVLASLTLVVAGISMLIPQQAFAQG